MNEKIKQALIENEKVQSLFKDRQAWLHMENLALSSDLNLAAKALNNERVKAEQKLIREVQSVASQFQTPSNLTLDISRGQIRA